ncbi:MAG TPA: acyltransferase [Terriglobales bacterium]|nr:acyltransferase [Terriglobales bacterium]
MEEKLVRPAMPELDTLRGLAILLVLFFHGFGFQFATAHLPRLAHLFVAATMPGWIGVNLFFVLSGFLITGILLDSKSSPHYYRRFYARRALRILPAYYAFLLFLSIAPKTGWLDHRQVSWQFIGLSFVYLSNVTHFFGVPMQYGALWSLAVEEHFYLAWPIVVRSLSRKAIAICAFSVVIICPLLRTIAFRRGDEYGAGYTWLVADGLAMGSLLGLFSRSWLADRERMKQAAIFCVGAAGALLACGAPFGIFLSRTELGGILRPTALNLFFAGALGSVLLIGTSNLKWIVRRPILQFFGRISYGLYLFHMLVFDFVDHLIGLFVQNSVVMVRTNFALICLRFAIAGILATATAALSRKYFEEWFLRLKEKCAPLAGSQQPMAPAFLGTAEDQLVIQNQAI